MWLLDPPNSAWFHYFCACAWPHMSALAPLLQLCAHADTTFAEDIARAEGSPTLEELAFHLGTDKSQDDHKYVHAYMALFDPIRWKVRNMMEIGVATGQSLQMWLEYFSQARVTGIDKTVHNSVKAHFRTQPRATLLGFNAYDRNAVQARADAQGWKNESFDIIIDDALHQLDANEKMLLIFWRFVRPGGYYIIEDVHSPSSELKKMDEHSPKYEPAHWNEEHIKNKEAKAIVQENLAFVVDSSFGHRNFSFYANTSTWGGVETGKPPFHANGRYRHTNFLIVLRKRTGAHPPRPWRQFYGQEGGAMTRTWIYERRAEKAAQAKGGGAATAPPQQSDSGLLAEAL